MDRSDIIDYFIGDPGGDCKRGRDAYGQVNCILWLQIYPKGTFFAKPDEYSLARGGGGLGRVKSKAAARTALYEYAIVQLRRQKAEAQDIVDRADAALSQLRGGPASLDKFISKRKKERKNG